MKKTNNYIIIVFIFFTSILSGQKFANIIEDTQTSFPTRIKSFNNAIYVSGGREINNVTYATFSKFDKIGNLLWTVQSDTSSLYLDFEFDSLSRSFLIVGYSIPLSGILDNESILTKVDDFGTTLFSRFYQQEGEEQFTKIIRHPNPVDPIFPYYILGTKIPSPNTSPNENLTVLWNINAVGNFNWVKDYSLFFGRTDQEGEVHKGLVPLSNGNVVMLGSSPTGYLSKGIIMEVDGDGQKRPIIFYQDTIQMRMIDGVELPNSSLAVVGGYLIAKNESQISDTISTSKFKSFQNGLRSQNPQAIGLGLTNIEIEEAFIAVSSPTFDSLQYGLRFQNIRPFHEIGMDDSGRLYAVGTEKRGLSRNIILRFINTDTSLTVDYARYLYEDDSDFHSPHFYINNLDRQLEYTDSRDSKILIASDKLDFNNFPCVDTFPYQAVTFSVKGDTIDYGINETTPNYSTGTLSNISLSQNPACLNGACLYGGISSSNITCREDYKNYEYYIFVDDLSGNDNLKDSCKIVVSNNQTGVTLTDSIYWIGNQAIIKGDITITQLPIPTALQLTVDLECPYKGRIDTCSFDVDFDPCCAMISVLDTAVCEVDRIINLPLITSQNFDPNNIARTTWFCTPAPYTNTSRWEACVTSFNFSPLEIQTNFGDFYYYAEVELDELERPCTILRSDTGSVTIAKPLTGCSIRSTNKPYCYNGTTITPKILTVNASLTDDSTIQWFDQNGIIPNATNTTYAPPPLSLPTNFMDCYMDFVYTVKIENACSSNTCSTSIRLYNEEAPKGELFIESNEALQLCSGEDLTLKYSERCTDLAGWQWSQSDDGLNYKPIQGAGSINPTWNTNSLYKDTRYRIIKKNGNVCPIDTLDLLVEIQEELSLTQLSFMYDNPCDPSSVTLSIDFNPCQVSCNYDVEWYYNGQLVQLTNHVSSPAMFTFNSSTLHGNYYAIVKDKTCPSQIQQSNTITLNPPYELYVLGPCFRCNNNIVSLRGVLFNPPDSVNCSYSWTTLEEGEILTGDSTNTITVGNGGVYILATNCNGCEKRDTFNLLQCGPEGATRSNIDALNYGKINLTIYPNPVVDQLSLLFESSLMENYQVEIYNSEGRLLLVESLQAGTTNHQINTTNLPANLYWIDLKNEYGSIWRERFIKQN